MPYQRGWHLSGKADQRHTVIIGRSNPGHQIGCTGPACNKADPCFSRRTRIPVSCMDKPLLVPWQNHADSLRVIKRMK